MPKKQDELAITGHAIEARLYAEDPAKGFLPSVGKLEHFDLGEREARIETGVEEGDAISPFYDPMIAKLIGSGDDREEAIDALAVDARQCRGLAGPDERGVLAMRVADHRISERVMIDTGFIERTSRDAECRDAEPIRWRACSAGAVRSSLLDRDGPPKDELR